MYQIVVNLFSDFKMIQVLEDKDDANSSGLSESRLEHLQTQVADAMMESSNSPGKG